MLVHHPSEMAEPKIQGEDKDMKSKHAQAFYATAGGILFTGSPSDFGKIIADETEKWAK